jgi:hypothetical protein
MEAVARKNPETFAELESVTELRRWQRSVLGADFLRALIPHRKTKGATQPVTPETTKTTGDESPYRD